MGYRELTKNFKLTITSTATSAVRFFIYTTQAADHEVLPKMGEKFPKAMAEGVEEGLYVRSLVKTFAGENALIPQWEVDYSTQELRSEGASSADLFASVDFSGEFLNIGKPDSTTSNTWSDGTAIEQDLFVRVITAKFSVPKVYMSLNNLLSKVRSTAGKVNSSTFYGNPAETVLFCGASANQFRNDKGQNRWRAVFSFEVRAPVLAGGGYGNWNYLWNEQKHQWMELTNNIYSTANFSALFSDISGAI